MSYSGQHFGGGQRSQPYFPPPPTQYQSPPGPPPPGPPQFQQSYAGGYTGPSYQQAPLNIQAQSYQAHPQQPPPQWGAQPQQPPPRNHGYQNQPPQGQWGHPAPQMYNNQSQPRQWASAPSSQYAPPPTAPSQQSYVNQYPPAQSPPQNAYGGQGYQPQWQPPPHAPQPYVAQIQQPKPQQQHAPQSRPSPQTYPSGSSAALTLRQPSTRFLQVNYEGNSFSKLHILDPSTNTILYNADLKTSKPNMVIRSAATGSQICTVDFHSFSTRIDIFPQNQQSFTLTSGGTWKLDYSYNSPALNGAKLTWKPQKKKNDLDMALLDDKGNPVGRFDPAGMGSVHNVGRIEVLGMEGRPGGLDEIVFTCVAIMHYRTVSRSAISVPVVAF